MPRPVWSVTESLLNSFAMEEFSFMEFKFCIELCKVLDGKNTEPVSYAHSLWQE
jgi:hypothetical protein